MPSYAIIRILEKRKLIYVYRSLFEMAEYSAPTTDDPDRKVIRKKILTVTLTYDGLCWLIGT